MAPYDRRTQLFVAASLLTTGIFLIDAFTQLDIAIAVLYIILIPLAATNCGRAGAVRVTILCLVLTFVGYAINHSGDHSGTALARCIVSSVAIIVSSLLALRGQAAANALREASRRKDEFLAMLAHELRNPLAPLMAGGALLKKAAGDAESVERVADVIIRQTKHMSGLIDDLLDVSRVTRGQVALERERVDVKRVMLEAIEQVRPLMEEKRHNFKVDIGFQAAFVCGDHKRLVQVVSNLLNNAAKFTPAGGTVCLRTQLIGREMVLEVSDTGVGISAELLPHVFELFSQAEMNPDRSQGGLGIGLALVKSLVELHGGSVSASSKGRDTGSVFSIKLPLLSEVSTP
jgi:signal transduction histidine kinase